VVYTLAAFGVVMSYSASAIFAEQVYGDSAHFLLRQLLYLVVGTFFLFAMAMVPTSFWKKNARQMMLLALVMLTLVFIPGIGRSAGGAKRWIWLGPFNFQPVEFAKIMICVYLADYVTRKIKPIQKGSLLVFFPPLFLVGATGVLLLMQPDLGSCFIIFLIVLSVFFLAGIHLRYVMTVLAVGVPVFYLLVVRVPYRMSRLTAYLNPWDDPQGSGFQIIQSFYAFALGGLKGVGLGQSAQKLFYLPSSYNDFIFSVIGEELGLIGVFSVLILYGVFLATGIRMATRARGDFEKILIMALVLLIVLQAGINMLVSTGLIPTKGLPLPFVSYGGTSLVFNLATVGILLGLDRSLRR
jgi:cell division protein FtsW